VDIKMYLNFIYVILSRTMFKRIKIKNIMPSKYFELMTRKEIKEHKDYIDKILDPKNRGKVFNLKSDGEECCFLSYDLKKLKNKILKVVSDSKEDILMYRIFLNKEKNIILANFYENLVS